MSWILLATGGQFINAVVAVMDKYIVSDERALPRPFVYAFYSCLVTGGWVIVFLLGYIPVLGALGVPTFAKIQTPTIEVVGMSFLAAYTFFIALVSMYDALKRADASDTMPIIGSVSALATFGMSYLFLSVQLHHNFVWGIVLLVLGTILVAQSLPRANVIAQVFHSGLFFALHYIAMKGLFLSTSFEDGFFWSRIAFVLFALSLLLVPAYFDKIKERTKGTSIQAGTLVLVAKIFAGIASFMLLKATDLGDVTVVQALGGIQYVFIVLIGALLVDWLPKTATDHDNSPSTFLRKMLYVSIILIGFLILFT